MHFELGLPDCRHGGCTNRHLPAALECTAAKCYSTFYLHHTGRWRSTILYILMIRVSLYNIHNTLKGTKSIAWWVSQMEHTRVTTTPVIAPSPSRLWKGNPLSWLVSSGHFSIVSLSHVVCVLLYESFCSVLYLRFIQLVSKVMVLPETIICIFLRRRGSCHASSFKFL